MAAPIDARLAERVALWHQFCQYHHFAERPSSTCCIPSAIRWISAAASPVSGAGMSAQPVDIQFALVSHTNNGKTTLARTLVGMDVGEVRDAAPRHRVRRSAHLADEGDAGDRLLFVGHAQLRRFTSACLKRLAQSRQPDRLVHSAKCSTATATARSGLSQQALRAAQGCGRRRCCTS